MTNLKRHHPVRSVTTSTPNALAALLSGVEFVRHKPYAGRTTIDYAGDDPLVLTLLWAWNACEIAQLGGGRCG